MASRAQSGSSGVKDFFDVAAEGLYEPFQASVATDDPRGAAHRGPGERADDCGFRGSVACAAAGISYRQLDYWARTGLVTPSVRGASGSGSTRLYSFRDILALQVVKRLLDSGVSLANIRIAVATLTTLGCAADLSGLTLISDGIGVYLCASPTEVIDLLRGGQGVFGIAVGQVWDEVQATLAPFPQERCEPVPSAPQRPVLRVVS